MRDVTDGGGGALSAAIVVNHQQPPGRSDSPLDDQISPRKVTEKHHCEGLATNTQISKVCVFVANPSTSELQMSMSMLTYWEEAEYLGKLIKRFIVVEEMPPAADVILPL